MNQQYREQAVRVDRIEIDGYGILRAKARIARIGVQEYWIDGIRVRELREPEDVKASAKSFSQQIITLDHPADLVLVDSGNAHQYAKGLTGEVTYEDGWLVAPITITHLDAVTAAQTTHKQFSNGYFITLDEKSGEWLDELGVMGIPGRSYPYDRIQRNIEGNHVALVRKARAGNKATYMDTEDFSINYTDDTSKKNMVKIVHNDRVFEIEGNDAQAVADIVSEYKTKLDSAATLIGDSDNLTAENTRLTTRNSELEGKIAGLEAPKKDDAGLSKEIAGRVNLWQLVRPHMDSEPDYSLSEIDIKKLYLAKTLPDLKDKIALADDAYVSGIWEIKQPRENSGNTQAVKDAFLVSKNAPKTDTEGYEAAREAYLDYRRHHSNSK